MEEDINTILFGCTEQMMKNKIKTLIKDLGFSDFDLSIVNRDQMFRITTLPDKLQYQYLHTCSGLDIWPEYIRSNREPIFQSTLYSPMQSFCYDTERVRVARRVVEIFESFAYHEYISIPLERDSIVAAVTFFSAHTLAEDVRAMSRPALQKLKSIASAVLAHSYHYATDYPRLTKKELEVLTLLPKYGGKASDIATAIKRSRRTVEQHLRGIRTKLGVHKTDLAILKALKLKIITLDDMGE